MSLRAKWYGVFESVKVLLNRPGSTPVFTAEDAARIGDESEVRVLKLCLEMARWNELPPRPCKELPWRTETYSTLDLDGVDIVVPTDLGEIYIQVKSSRKRFLEFVSKPGREKIICINGQWPEAVIHKRLLSNIWGRYRVLKKLEIT